MNAERTKAYGQLNDALDLIKRVQAGALSTEIGLRLADNETTHNDVMAALGTARLVLSTALGRLSTALGRMDGSGRYVDQDDPRNIVA